MKRLLILVVASLVSLPARGESVTVKYGGVVDLKPFECTSISRSSFVNRICYDKTEKYMLILLHNTYYHYCGIDSDTVSQLLGAGSIGHFYNTNIKGISIVG
jgi:hypothetical protein